FHSFFSYNCCGYSPSKLAWLSKKAGVEVAGVVDFDVLDALEEFYAAACLLNLKACAGIETRVFVPEFATRVINSPGEPGISYHVGVGFPIAKPQERQTAEFLKGIGNKAQQRNQSLTARVNEYLKPVELDFQADVLSLTPSGNPTERHICLAYTRKARAIFSDDNDLAKYWSEKLSVEIGTSELPESGDLLNTIRAKTMKQGGVGYVKPDKDSFPLMADMNAFILQAGGIPVFTWLNGLTDGEKAIDELLEVSMSTGAAAVNIIPDRNYTPGISDEKLAKLYDIVERAEKLNLPVVVGTEMNSPGQKFVDDFKSKELSPLVPIFLKGAHIVYAHTILGRKAGLGYTSKWAANNFNSVSEKNKFFESVGMSLLPQKQNILANLTDNSTPKEILDLI
ncbi:hypothetical protein ACFL3G_08390, partial [Planctomycetota bacterium]